MSMTHDGDTKLMYQPFSSILNPGFWQQLTNIKLNQLKLSTEPVDIHGSYSCNLSDTLPCLASFEHSSFGVGVTESGNKSACPLYGQLICTNIIQEFLDHNKKEFIDSYGNEIWQSICDGRALAEPEKFLSRFGLLVYADLKKYKFYYWFCFPAINYPKDVFTLASGAQSDCLGNKVSHRPILEYMSENSLKTIQEEYDKPARNFSRGYFIVKHYTNLATGGDEVLLYPLTDYSKANSHEDWQKDPVVYFAYSDPSASSIYPGWPLRNFLCLIAVQFKLDRLNIIRIRKGQPTQKSKLELHHSMVIEIAYNQKTPHDKTEVPPVTGWEKNESQQTAPKRVNLSNLLDPKKLAEDAVNLNLRLMKWRLLPGLDLDKIARTKCLILGCGTLGCHVARGLLAWGVKKLSIVDNGRVSYSNPVRQTLYTFDDCASSSGTFKAEAAAASLKRIHPLVDVSSYIMSIPMPGHHIADKEVEQTKKDISTLEELIEAHDAIFLLMDTRESRWLPTVIAVSKQKLVINAAIGFDTFLLQRFGVRDYANFSEDQMTPSSDSSTTTPSAGASRSGADKPTERSHSTSFLASDELGCYFCNDIVAPGDSTQDRTLDQQCTVSRPGVSMMVSAMAVELLASIVSSDMGALTPAPLDVHNDHMINDEDFGSELGIVPHSVRGNLARYHIYMPTSPSFNKCAACSPAVVNSYRNSGYDFLQQVFDDPSHLEEVAGLKDLQNVSDNVWAIDSDEDELASIESKIDELKA